MFLFTIFDLLLTHPSAARTQGRYGKGLHHLDFASEAGDLTNHLARFTLSTAFSNFRSEISDLRSKTSIRSQIRNFKFEMQILVIPPFLGLLLRQASL